MFLRRDRHNFYHTCVPDTKLIACIDRDTCVIEYIWEFQEYWAGGKQRRKGTMSEGVRVCPDILTLTLAYKSKGVSAHIVSSSTRIKPLRPRS